MTDNKTTERMVHARFVGLAEQRPDLVAVVTASGSWTYRELDRASIDVGRQLRDRGVEAGDIVVIDCDRSASLVIFLLASVRIGAVFLVLGEDWPADYVAGVLESLDGCYWLSKSKSPPRGVAAGKLRQQLILADPECPGQTREHGYEESVPGPGSEAGDPLMYLAATSGTTGIPKLVKGTHSPVSHFLEWYQREFGFTEADRFALLSGLGFDPMLRDVFAPLSCGATLWIPSRSEIQSKQGLAAWLARSRVSVIHSTPGLAKRVFESGDRVELPDLRLIALSGAAFTRELATRIARKARNAVLANLYGTTETPQAVSCYAFRANELPNFGWASAPTSGTVPLGHPVEGFELTVVDENGHRRREGEVGEICICSRYLSQGYVDRALPEVEENRPAHRGAERVYATGDLGYFSDRLLVFAGRRDRQVKYRGYRLQLEEIESVISHCPCVRHAAVTTRTSKQAEVRLICYIEPRRGFTSPVTDIRRHVLTKLPTYMLPERFVLVDKMPLTARGKIDFSALPDVIETPIEYRDHVPESALAVQNQLLELFASILDVAKEHLRVDSNFFEAGGDSLLVGRFVNELAHLFDRELKITDVFMHPNVRELARYLTATEPLSDAIAMSRHSDIRRHRITAIRAKRMGMRQ